METDFKQSYGKDVRLAGVVTGLALFVVYLLSCFFKWELGSSVIMRSVLIFVVLVGAALLFGLRRAKKAGDQEFRYGQALGFLAVVMVIAAVVGAIGMVLLQTLIAPDYYEQVFAMQQEMTERILESNPLLASSSGDVEAGMALGTNPIMQFLGTLFNIFISGLIVSLFVAIFVKK